MFTLVTSPASQLVINRLNYLFIVPDLLILVCVCVCVCVSVYKPKFIHTKSTYL